MSVIKSGTELSLFLRFFLPTLTNINSFGSKHLRDQYTDAGLLLIKPYQQNRKTIRDINFELKVLMFPSYCSAFSH